MPPSRSDLSNIRNGLYDLKMLAGPGKNDKLSRYLGHLLMAIETVKTVADWYRVIEQRLSYTITVESEDDLFIELHRWLIQNVPPTKQRGRTVWSRRKGVDDSNPYRSESPAPSAPNEPQGELLIELTSNPHTIVTSIKGHRVKIELAEQERALGGIGMDHRPPKRKQRMKGDERIIITVKSIEAQRAVQQFLQELADEIHSDNSTSRLWITDRWGNWHHSAVKARPMDTVVLADGLAEDLIADMERFLSSEDHYNAIGQPWHRGYLFHGPPGTGKSSLARALAGHFGMDVYYITLSDLDSEADLASTFSNVRERSLLLIEDVDATRADTEVRGKKGKSKKTANGVTLSGLLNALDGMITPHGLIAVMTTNDLDALDEALVRAGRADRKLHIDYLDDEQFARFVRLLIGGAPLPRDLPPVPEKTSAADVAEAAKAAIGEDPETIFTTIEKAFS